MDAKEKLFARYEIIIFACLRIYGTILLKSNALKSYSGRGDGRAVL